MSFIKAIFLLIVLITAAYTQAIPESPAEEAIKVARKEVAANPNSAEAYFRLGEAYLSHSYSVADKAAEAFFKSVQLNPTNPEAYYKLALAYDREHRHRFQEIHPKGEIEALRQAINLKPDYAEAYVQLARTYMRNATFPNLDLGKTYKPAVEILNKAIAIKPDLAEAYEELGLAYSVLKEDGKAKEAYEKAKELKKEREH